MEFAALLKDGHTAVIPPWGLVNPEHDTPPVEVQVTGDEFIMAMGGQFLYRLLQWGLFSNQGSWPAGADTYERISRIRVEYHDGRAKEIESHLSSHGFVQCRSARGPGSFGTMWFEKAHRRAMCHCSQD